MLERVFLMLTNQYSSTMPAAAALLALAKGVNTQEKGVY